MATYRSIASTETDPQAPITSALMKALEANHRAAMEGDATAVAAGVTLQFPAMGTWFTTAGGVGTYVFARRGTGTTDVAFGTTLAGSNLVPTSAMTSNSGSSGTMGSAFNAAAALAGTWRCMGEYDHTVAGTGGGSYLGATLWMRIS